MPLSLLVIFTFLRKEYNAITILSWGTAILLWALYDKIVQKGAKFDISPWRSYFFFIYLFHDPWLNMVCAYASRNLPDTFIMNTLVFVASQALIIAVSLWLAGFLNGRFPKFYAMITGKR